MHGCIDHGHPQHALHLYQQMQEDGLSVTSLPLLRTLLKACAKLKDSAHGQFFHFRVVKFGFETDPYVGSALVDMYAKSDSIVCACDIFYKLRDRDAVLWTTIIAGYIEHGLVDDGFKSVEAMQGEGISPNAVTFSCILKGCGSKTFLDRAHQVHLQIAKQGFEKVLHVENALVDAYAKCGSVMEAEKIFQKLIFRDVILWTSLIMAYADNGHQVAVLHCLDQMQEEGVSPNGVTYMCSLKAFGDTKFRDKVHYIHSQIVLQGLESRSSVGGTLVYTYGKCGSLEDAQGVLDGLPVQDIYSFNALILAYTDQELDFDALEQVEKMQVEGLSSNAFTFVSGLKACGRQRLIEKGLWLHAEITKEEFEQDLYVACALVDMYSKCGFFPEAWTIVEQVPAQTTVIWTALISGYLEHSYFNEALNCLRMMQDDGILLDVVTFVCGLKACAGVGAVEAGQQLHVELVVDGHEKEPSIGNTLVDMYAKCGFLTEAEDVFDELSIQQLVSWTALISGCMELKLFEKALKLYARIPLQTLTLDSVIFMSGLKACGSLGALDRGQLIYADIAMEGFEEDPAICSSLVDMYAKCGSLVEAFEVFNGMSVQNLVLWTALITGFACQGNSKAVYCMLDKLTAGGIQPDIVTMLNVATVCSHAGLLEEGLSFFEAVSQAVRSVPSPELYNCLMDLVSRAGLLNEALALIEQMPFHPNLVTWNTILGACQRWKSIKLGELAFRCALHLDCKQPAPYASMISIYADARMWEDVKKIDTLRKVACCNGLVSSSTEWGMLYAL